MKKLLLALGLFVILLKTVEHFKPTKIYVAPAIIVDQPVKKVSHTIKKSYRGNVNDLLMKLARYESGGQIDVVNRFGYMGKYQFSRKALLAVGIDVPQEEFLTNENLQDSAAVLYMKHNEVILKRTIKRFDHKIYGGIYVTKSGILASAHLVGPGGVLAYFYPDRYSHPTSDANGMTVAKYLAAFSRYKI